MCADKYSTIELPTPAPVDTIFNINYSPMMLEKSLSNNKVRNNFHTLKENEKG